LAWEKGSVFRSQSAQPQTLYGVAIHVLSVLVEWYANLAELEDQRKILITFLYH
jgi:hypothetical protein